MSTTVIVGNVVMLAGCILLVIAANAKTDALTVRLQTIQLMLAATANMILGGYAGATLNVVSIIRNVIVLRGLYYIPVRIFFVIMMFVTGILSGGQNVLKYGIATGNAVFSACLGLKKEGIVKLALAFCISWWILYDFSNQNYVGAAFDVATLVSAITGYIRARRTANSTEE